MGGWGVKAAVLSSSYLDTSKASVWARDEGGDSVTSAVGELRRELGERNGKRTLADPKECGRRALFSIQRNYDHILACGVHKVLMEVVFFIFTSWICIATNANTPDQLGNYLPGNLSVDAHLL